MFYYIRLNILYRVNKFNKLLHISKKHLKIFFYIKGLFNYLFSKSLYIVLILMLNKLLGKYLNINEIIFILTLIGGVFNTIMFSPDKTIYLLFVKYNYKYLLMLYVFKIVINYLLLIVFILLRGINIETILLIIFVLLSKNIFNIFYINLIKKKNYYYHEEEVSKYTLINLFIILVIAITLIINIVSLQVLLTIMIFIGLYSIIKIIKNKNIYKIYLNMEFNDFYIKELVSLSNKKVSEVEDGEKYLANIFNKRHIKYYLLYSVKSLLIIILFIVLDDKSTIDSFMEVFSIVFIINSNNKLIDLFYYKCDYYLNKKSSHKNNRLNMMFIVALPSMIVLTLKMILHGSKLIYIILSYLILIFIIVIKYNIYEKYEIFKNKTPTKIYYCFDVISIISILIYDLIVSIFKYVN